MYELIGGLKSRAFRVAWALEELHQDYAHHVEFPHSQKVREHSKIGKIPVLLDDGIAITDSVAIIQYLADRHGALTSAAGTLERARQDSITQQVSDDIDQLLWWHSRHKFILPEDLRSKDINLSISYLWERNLKALSRVLGNGPYLMGDTFTVPDIILGHCGGWARSQGFEVPEGPLRDYFRNVIQRDGYKAAAAKRDV